MRIFTKSPLGQGLRKAGFNEARKYSKFSGVEYLFRIYFSELISPLKSIVSIVVNCLNGSFYTLSGLTESHAERGVNLVFGLKLS